MSYIVGVGRKVDLSDVEDLCIEVRPESGMIALVQDGAMSSWFPWGEVKAAVDGRMESALAEEHEARRVAVEQASAAVEQAREDLDEVKQIYFALRSEFLNRCCDTDDGCYKRAGHAEKCEFVSLNL